MVDVGVEHVPLFDPSDLRGWWSLLGLDEGPDLSQAALLADGLGAREAELQTVVFLRVVAGGEHHARQVERAAREVQEIGGGESEVDDVGSSRRGTLREGGGQLR